MHLLRLELRHSPTLLLLPILILLVGISTERGLIPGVQLGDNITTSVISSVQLLGPISAGLAAWFATRDRRRGVGYLRRLSARSNSTLVLVEALAVALPAILAIALVTGFVTARAALVGLHGDISLLGLLSALAGLLVHVSLGYAAGRLWPRAAVAPIVTLASYLYIVWNLDQAGRSFYLLAPVTVERATASYTWWPDLFLWQSLWLLGVAMLPLFLLGWDSTRRLLPRLGILFLVAGMASVGGARLWSYGGHFFDLKNDPISAASVCTDDSGLRVCTHPAFATGHDELVRQFKPVLNRLASTPAATDRLEQARRGPNTGEGSTVLYLEDLAPGFAQQAVAEFISNQIDVNACAAPSRSDAFPFTRLVADWIITDDPAASSYSNLRPAAAEALSRLNGEDEQRRWLQDHFEDFRTCQLDDRSFEL